MFTKFTLGLLVVTLATFSLLAQTPAPIVVQAVGQPANVSKAAAAPSDAPISESTLKSLMEIKATNEEILRKQAATLLQLEEMEKTADQLRVYSKRG